MRQLARTWWEISTSHDAVVRVSEHMKETIVSRIKLLAAGNTLLDDAIVEGEDAHGIEVAVDVRTVDAWWISSPESRDIARTHNALLNDEQDAFDREHKRGDYKPKPKQWTPDSDDD